MNLLVWGKNELVLKKGIFLSLSECSGRMKFIDGLVIGWSVFYCWVLWLKIVKFWLMVGILFCVWILKCVSLVLCVLCLRWIWILWLGSIILIKCLCSFFKCCFLLFVKVCVILWVVSVYVVVLCKMMLGKLVESVILCFVWMGF